MKPPPIQTIVLPLAGVIAALAFLLPWLGVWNVPWVVTLYAGNSILAFVAYGSDKRRSIQNMPRWSEHGLHLLELAGGFPGAFVAQRVWRHKTRKVPYQLIFWGIVVVHAALWGWRFFGTPGGRVA